MPQVDLASVCGGGADRKIACETTLPNNDDDPLPDNEQNHQQQPDEEEHDHHHHHHHQTPLPPHQSALDYPPESYYISREEEFDWIDQNAYIERKGSGKSGSQISHSANLNPNVHHQNQSASQRYSNSGNLKSKPSIFALPKPQKAAYAEAKNRHHRPVNIHLFPKRSGQPSVGGGGSKPPALLLEPSSPKVSCMGRVKSRKERSRRKKNDQKRKKQLQKQQQGGGPGGDPLSSSIRRSISINKSHHKSGFWTNFRSIFRPKGRKSKSGDGGGDNEDGVEVIKGKKERKRGCKKSRSVKRKQYLAESEDEQPDTAPPRLGSINRFTSGRRSAAWAGELELNGAMSEPLDRYGSSSIWARRNVGPIGEVQVNRRWQQGVGPLSV